MVSTTLAEQEIVDKYFAHTVLGAYETLRNDGAPLYLESIVESVYWDVYDEARTQRVDESLQRGDHHLYNLGVEEYLRFIYMGVIDDDFLEPGVAFDVICANTINVLNRYQYFYIGYGNESVNCPLQEVW